MANIKVLPENSHHRCLKGKALFIYIYKKVIYQLYNLSTITVYLKYNVDLDKIEWFRWKNTEAMTLRWKFVHIRKPSIDFNVSEDMRAGSFPMPYQQSCAKSGQMSRDHSAPDREGHGLQDMC